ncbi:MAG: MFS transporter [Firmicutes bacterium]|nr:MFS transporter [Bacillota bacterium]
MGLELGAFGPAIAEWMQAFATGPATIGLVFSASSVGAMAATLGYAPAVARHGLRTVLVAGAALFGLGLGAAAAAVSPAMLLAGFVAAGAGFGALDSGINHLYVRLFPGARAVARNLVHLFFAIGAAAAPVTMALVLPAVGWRAAYATLAAAGLVLAPALYVTCPVAPALRQGEPARATAAWRWLGAVLAPAVAMALYVGVEVTVSGWVYSFLAQEAQAPPVLAGAGVSVFWAGLAAGRLALGPAVERAGYRASLVVGAGVAGASLLAAVLPVGPVAAVALLGLCGLAMSIIFPTLMALASTRVPPAEEATAAATAVMLLAASAGNMTLPALAGTAAGWADLGVVIAALGLLLPAGFVLTLAPGASTVPQAPGGVRHDSVRASSVPVRRTRPWARQSQARPADVQTAAASPSRASSAPSDSAPSEALKSEADGLNSRRIASSQ